MKSKKRALRDPNAIKAARELIRAQRERLGAEPDGITHIVTGVQRSPDFGKWGDTQMPDRYGVYPKPPTAHKPPPKPSVASEPARLPVRWEWFCTQTAAPSYKHPQGVIAEGFYGVSDGVVYVEDMRSNPLGSQQLQRDDNAAAVARKILKDRRRDKLPGFYDSLSYNPNRIFH